MLINHVILAEDRVMVRRELSRILEEKRHIQNMVGVWTPTTFREFVEMVCPHVKILRHAVGAMAIPMPGLMPLEEFKTLIVCRDESRDDFPCALESLHERHSLAEHGDKEILRAIERICYGGVYVFYLSPVFFNRLSLVSSQFHKASQSTYQPRPMPWEESNPSTTATCFS